MSYVRISRHHSLSTRLLRSVYISHIKQTYHAYPKEKPTENEGVSLGVSSLRSMA